VGKSFQVLKRLIFLPLFHQLLALPAAALEHGAAHRPAGSGQSEPGLRGWVCAGMTRGAFVNELTVPEKNTCLSLCTTFRLKTVPILASWRETNQHSRGSIELPYRKNTTESFGVGEVVHFVRGEGGQNPSASSGQALDYADVLGGMTRVMAGAGGTGHHCSKLSE
jgi:hypothetical protein